MDHMEPVALNFVLEAVLQRVPGFAHPTLLEVC